MASQKNFAITPSVSISRSKFRRPSQHKTTFNLGQIVPIYLDEILPGDTVSLDLAALIRMSTPIAPIMDNIHIDYYAFYAPNRILWDGWKEFMGESSSAGAVTPSYIPQTDILTNRVSIGKLGDYLGLPTSDILPSTGSLKVSTLPGRFYLSIYNEWLRDQNLIPVYPVNKGATGIGSDPVLGGTFNYNHDLLIAAKESDYFTRALPYAQKGSPVTLPLGSEAEVYFKANTAPTVIGIHDLGIGLDTTSNTRLENGWRADATGDTVYGHVVADLSNATAATINQLRFAFQYQKFLEKDALYGTRYWEILKGHFGITAPDASLQRPELLGHWRQHINIDQVLQTSESGTTALGTPGANSVSGGHSHLISKSFVEHGYIMIVAIARHEQTYGQGLNRFWSRFDRTDFYFPVFANLGAQEIKVKELYCGDSSKFDNVFGYQEAWAEYRYKPSIVTNLMNPAHTNSLSFWNLANNFGAVPTLSKSFIEQDRTNLNRALTTGSTGPDFIADFYFDSVYVRPMPMYSIPGLIDHH